MIMNVFLKRERRNLNESLVPVGYTGIGIKG